MSPQAIWPIGHTYQERRADGSLACWRVIGHRPLLTPPGTLGIVAELYAVYPPGTATAATEKQLATFDTRPLVQ